MPARMLPCPRCGVPRIEGSNIAVVCKDCREVLSLTELEEWAA